MEEDLSEGKLFATFENHEEFLNLQSSLLSLDISTEPSAEDNRAEELLLRKLSDILDQYQEQAYLLDPFLEVLVAPVVERLKRHTKDFISRSNASVSPARLRRVTLLLYNFIKFRGYKTITRFFPHEISDLSITLDYILSPNSPAQDASQWPLRYVVLLWLSLVCMIPFDLEQFDEQDRAGETATRVESLAKSYLGKAGLEREGAAILLSRLYMRKDMGAKLPAFLDWSISIVQVPSDPFEFIGILQVLCEVTKLGAAEQVKEHLPLFLQVTRSVNDNETLINNTIVRKLRTKLISRFVLRLLPRIIASRNKGRALTSDSNGGMGQAISPGDDDFDVPEEVESVLEDLFKALQDKDTIVRYSSAKGIARISERLPVEFTEQVLDTVMGLFSIHSIAVASIYDMPSIAESTWHGACLACAEMARRGLVADEKLTELIGWLSKALYFDIRKGSHSIGSNVRDAASYVLWSLARAQSVAAPEPHAMKLARRLATVSLFDREIHIRRAASAAFQEYVGRTSLFPHGIDVLRKTDFYAVGVRRNAFLVAAPEVAEHEEYRTSLIDHLLSVTLRHWDPAMRQLGAQSLRAICQLDLAHLAPNAARRASQLLGVPDAGDVHGALLALTEIAAAFGESRDHYALELERKKVFTYLHEVPLTMIQSPRHELVTAASCRLIASSISLDDIQLNQDVVPSWRQIVDSGFKSRSSTVQEAAATALASVSRLSDWASMLTLIHEFSSGSPPMQQSLCMLLGVLDYSAHPHGILQAIWCLLRCADRSSHGGSMTIEARRNAYNSMPQILLNVAARLPEHLSPTDVCQMIDALQDGLRDYTTDERGDVGSWIRVTCVKGLMLFIETLFAHAHMLPNFAEYFPPEKFHSAIGGILKQGIERLDNVRQQAGESFLRLLLLSLPSVPDAEQWRICGDAKMKGLFLSGNETIGWNEGAWLFPKAVHLLDIKEYREAVLSGLILSASTKTDSTQRPVTSSLVAYVMTLPVATMETDHYDLRSLAQDLLAQASSNVASNNVVIPVLQTFNILLEADAFERLPQDPAGQQCLRTLLALVSRNVPRLKNPQRILMSMKIVINLLPMSELRSDCIVQLTKFLVHQYPKIRADTAEHLYLMLESKDLGYETDEAEDIILETEWSSGDLSVVEAAAQRFISLLHEHTT